MRSRALADHEHLLRVAAQARRAPPHPADPRAHIGGHVAHRALGEVAV